MFSYMVKAGTKVELEVYGILNALDEPSQVMCAHDRHFSDDQLTDDFMEDGERFFVFTVTSRDCDILPCGIGIIVNQKDIIKL